MITTILAHIIAFYCICTVYDKCEATLFRLMVMEKMNTNNIATCKLLKFANITTEVACGRECKSDHKCVYFKHKAMYQECFVCTIGEITSTQKFTTVSSELRNLKDVFKRVHLCNNSTDCKAKDCSEYRTQGYVQSGIYDIVTNSGKSIKVYCDMETDGGGWTVFQRRIDGSEDFYRTWAEYEKGFGNLNNEFWLGNIPLSDITSQGSYQMRVDMSDFDGNFVYAAYNLFSINANDYYRMNYASFQGNVGDSLAFSKGWRFTTKDRDYDGSSSKNCAVNHVGAWWYNLCHKSNLNGLYLNGPYHSSRHGDGVNWFHFRDLLYSLKFTEMKLRPLNYTQPYDFNMYNAELPPPRDCAEHRDRGATESGIYLVTTRGVTKGTFSVYCDMKMAGGGWLVFQRRIDGSVDFLRNYNEYQNGFGNLSSEFWLGNDNLSSITEQGSYELRVDLEDFDNVKKYANYGAFSINRNDKYRLRLGPYSGNAGNSLNDGNGKRWTTTDADNDLSSDNCAVKYKGAWWYSKCHYSNLNGLYLRGSHTVHAIGVNWHGFKGYHYSLKFTELKLRPAGYTAPV